ncbi:hypothetical protein HNP84_001457 [Thermocatellispora tengchongensis]|uniref:DUF2567 domain-containing protein n=1 Tax=Thermocatellispora tengchongensis TaxID=1073253 RepID=A0A840NST4_9ACTN|nr:hypothetical protein [Thermocatellispora tengchongensis]MBB5131744.1 hypothetical protein [Thermocatellispora tengchongensis]
MRHLRDFAATVLILAVAGVAAGLLWSYVAPRAPYVPTDGGLVLADASTQSLIAADGWFAVITGGAGIVCGVAAFAIGRDRLTMVLSLAGGGLLAGFLARWIGGAVNLGTPSVSASGVTGHVVPGSLGLTATGVIVSWPLLAVAVFGLMVGFGTYRDTPPPPPPLDGTYDLSR